MKFSLMIARFPGGGVERHESSGWIMNLLMTLKERYPEIDRIVPWKKSDTPITMVRNKCVRTAIKEKVDYVLMIDNDMEPDPCDPAGNLIYPGAKPFWDSTWEFMMGHRDVACAVCAPYCGPSPHNNMYVFKWRNQNNKFDSYHWSLEQYDRETAAIMGGIEEIAAAPTGLILYDTRIFQTMIPGKDTPNHNWKGWFYYEWKDHFADEKASTEDVTQTRDMSLAWYATGGQKGGKLYCNWDAFAHHIKPEHIPKPRLVTADQIGSRFREVILAGRSQDEKLMMIRNDDGLFDLPAAAGSVPVHGDGHPAGGPGGSPQADPGGAENAQG